MSCEDRRREGDAIWCEVRKAELELVRGEGVGDFVISHLGGPHHALAMKAANALAAARRQSKGDTQDDELTVRTAAFFVVQLHHVAGAGSELVSLFARLRAR